MARLNRRGPAPAAALALAAVLVAGLGTNPPAAAGSRQPSSSTVAAVGGPHPFTWEWNPAEVTIARRGTVTWENRTDAVHHVTFYEGPSDASLHMHGRRARMTFKKPGVYKYLCDIFGHAHLIDTGYGNACVGMCGTVTVE